MEKPKVKHELEIAYGSTYGIEEEAALMEVLRANAPSCGKKVKQFEDAFAAYCGVKHALAVTSATTGLTLAGIAAGVGPDTEVITTPVTWVATAFAFSALGARIVFCDVDPRSLNMDPGRLEALITPKTRAIVPVHLAGQCCAMDRIMEIARRRKVAVIEDCAHNPGGSYLGRKAGALADLGVFSFHQQKNMGTLGEGGMVTTDDRALFERVLSYRSLCCRTYGGSDKYLPIDEAKHPMGKEYWRLFFDDVGYNYRMTDAQAAVGIEQLKKLDGHNARRIAIGGRLAEGLAGIPGLELPWVDPKGVHVYHFFVVQLGKGFPMSKADFMWELYTNRGIKPWSHYTPVHLTEPYRRQGHGEGECPVAEAAHGRYVSLPVHPRLTDEAVEYLIANVREVAGASPLKR
ncbi:MAG: DegT/DnrJ/EryC1/StrS family aminotransferase [Spirochaetes bacterium]|nr:DegT/DnrJ/EryC1/StrS family aminotransferase [Spirochaetota bacterium]